MKYKKKKEKLKARISHYERTYTNESDIRSHKRPGSQTK